MNRSDAACPMPHPARQPIRVAGLALCLASAMMLAGPGGARAQGVLLPGQPTYSTFADLQVQRGGGFVRSGGTAQGAAYKSQGASGSVSAARPQTWFSSPPSDARAQAYDRHLHATAVASGELFFLPGQVPFVSAMARAETLGFYRFDNDWTIAGIPALLGGVLGGHIGFAEQLVQDYSRVHFSMVWTDVQGQPLATVFGIDVQLDYDGRVGFPVQRRVSGYATQTALDQSFSATALAGAAVAGPRQAWRIGYIERINTPLVALAGHVYGFHWVLEAEARLEGNSVAGLFVSDFGFTADIGLGLSEEQMAALGITEVLAVPAAVPEPATAVLLLLGLAGLVAGLRRRS